MKKIIFFLFVIAMATVSFAQSSQPYSQWYGNNSSYDRYTEHSEVTVKAPYDSDVIVIIRNNNQYGNVAGHKFIPRGTQESIDLGNGVYQVFFYYGTGWSYAKEMGNGIKGGFTKGEMFSKDSPVSLYNQELTYELVLRRNGNFNTQRSNKNEVF